MPPVARRLRHPRYCTSREKLRNQDRAASPVGFRLPETYTVQRLDGHGDSCAGHPSRRYIHSTSAVGQS